MPYAVYITKSLTVPGVGDLKPGDVVLGDGADEFTYRQAPPGTNVLLHVFAAEAGELLNPDQSHPDLAAVVGSVAPYQFGRSHAPEAPPSREPVGRRRQIHRLK